MFSVRKNLKEGRQQNSRFDALNRLPVFQQFMQQHSQLASLFRLPNNYGSGQSLSLYKLGCVFFTSPFSLSSPPVSSPQSSTHPLLPFVQIHPPFYKIQYLQPATNIDPAWPQARV